MTFKNTIKTSLRGLQSHKSRSALTILGIVIGITSIILVMSVGQGAQDLILNQIRGLGSQTIIVEPGREPKGPSEFTEIFTDSLKQREVDAIKNPINVQGIKEISPNVVQVTSVSSKNETIRTSIIGSSNLIFRILDAYPNVGTYFTDEDIRQKSSVAVIGSKIKEKLFGDSEAVGQKIKIKNRTFRVIGTLTPKGNIGMINIDEIILVPYSTAQDYLIGNDHFNSFLIQAENEEIVPRVVKDIKLTLRELHNIDDPEKDDFHVMTQADAVERASAITDILTILLVSVAAISLLVGGIGIMNIMLVSVTERTREIGLRKSIGATEKDILGQFLSEAVFLTAIGGIIGILLGAALSYVASLILSRMVSLGWTFAFPMKAAILGLTVSAGIGLIFGIYPARKAAIKNPIEALRYE